MGLDQYIKKNNIVSESLRERLFRADILPEHIRPIRIRYIQEEVGYFRKFWELHCHIMNIEEAEDDNCRDFYFNPYIRTLNLYCSEILADRDPAVAEQYLPNPEGVYDAWYFGHVRELKETLVGILAEDPKLEHSYYYYAWY